MIKLKFIQIENTDKVAILKLNRGITNPINLELVNELSENLINLIDNPDIHSLILTSTNNKFFSIGFSLPELIKLNEKDLTTFYRAFNRLCIGLYTFPKPTIAALRGHAIAGGCILALCCDYRFISEGRKLMGLNEIKLGLPVPYPGDCILRNLVGSQIARDVMENGEFYSSTELFKIEIADEVLPLEEVLPKSIEKAKLLDSLPQDAFKVIKNNRTEMIEIQIKKYLGEKEKSFLECWKLKTTQELLKEATKKF